MAPDIIGRLFHVAFLDVGPHGDIAILIGHPHVVRCNNIYIGDQPAGTQQAARIDCLASGTRICLHSGVLTGNDRGLRTVAGFVCSAAAGLRFRGGGSISGILFLRFPRFPHTGALQIISHNGRHAGRPVGQTALLPLNEVFPEKMTERKRHDERKY